jgi:hypothetical protein
MSLYKPKKSGSMIQVAGNGGPVQSVMEGKERIYSQKDTRKIISMAKSAKSNNDFVELGRFVLSATKLQDARPPEFVEK